MENDITPLDRAWEAVNALGGTTSTQPPIPLFEDGYVAAINDALKEIERLGGGDPLAKVRKHQLSI